MMIKMNGKTMNKTWYRQKASLPMMLVCVFLAGCTEHGDLQAWMSQEKDKAAQEQRKPEEFKPPVFDEYVPPSFSGLNAFDENRLSLARKKSTSSGNAPDFDRPKEILEGFGLDKIEYVGSLINVKQGKRLAFVKVDDHVYTVRIGNHMGSNYGRIISIDPDKIVLEESVENTNGDWVLKKAEKRLSVAAE